MFILEVSFKSDFKACTTMKIISSIFWIEHIHFEKYELIYALNVKYCLRRRENGDIAIAMLDFNLCQKCAETLKWW